VVGPDQTPLPPANGSAG